MKELNLNDDPMKLYDPTNKAIGSLVLGLVGIVAWIIPLVGVIITGLGISMASTGRKSSKKGIATAGMILCIIFLIVSIINWISGIVLNASFFTSLMNK